MPEQASYQLFFFAVHKSQYISLPECDSK